MRSGSTHGAQLVWDNENKKTVDVDPHVSIIASYMNGFNTPINIKVCQTVLKSTNQLRSL